MATTDNKITLTHTVDDFDTDYSLLEMQQQS